MISLAFCALYVINGIIGERAYELVIFMATTVIIIVYVIMNYFSKKDDIKLVK